MISNFMPTYLKYKYIFFSSLRFQVGSGIFFQLSQIRIRGKKCRILIPGCHSTLLLEVFLMCFQCVFSVNRHSKYIWYRMLVQGLHNKNCENANGINQFFSPKTKIKLNSMFIDNISYTFK